MKKVSLLFVMVLMGCSSATLVENWKNPDIVIFDANKVLLVGISNDEKARVNFETKLKKEFEKQHVEAVRSVDIFDMQFTRSERTEKDLDEFEQQLLERDFDAILLTKIVGSESRQRLKKSVNDFYDNRDGFNEDYRRNQQIYYDGAYYDNYTVYHAETSLYCICVGKERSLIWRGSIDIMDPKDINKTVDDYVKLVIVALEEQDLILRKKNNEATGI